MSKLPIFSALAIFFFSYLWGASFIVSTNEDRGPGSLRQAILDLNASKDLSNTITMNPGLETIQLVSDLPVINVPVEFNLSKQGDLKIHGNTNQYRVYGVLPGLTPVPRIQLDNSSSLRLSGKVDIGTVFSSGDGKLILDGSNTYTGGTIVNGPVDISGTGALDPRGSVTVNAGMFSISGITAASQTIGDLMGTGGTVFIEGKTLITGTNEDTSYAGVIFGGGSLVKQGSGTLTLTGANVYSKGTTVNEGSLLGNTLSLRGNIVNNASVVFDQSLLGIYAGVISGPGSVTKENVEILTFTGVNTYEGVTIIREGELALSAEGALSPTGAIAIEMDGSFDISDITHASQTIGDLSGSGVVELGVKELILGTSKDITYGGVINGTGNLVKQGSGIFTLTGAATYTGGTTINAGTVALLGKGSLSSSGVIIISDKASFDISGMTAGSQTISDLSGTGGNILLGDRTLIEQTFNSTTYAGVISGEGKLIKKGSSTLTLSEANTYSGGTTINGGALALLGDGSLAPTGSVTTTGKAIFDISGMTASSQAIGDLSGTGGSIILGEKTLITETSNDTSYSGVISGIGDLIKQGSGVLSLRGVNTYSGGTTINAGTIALLGTGSLSVTGPLTINDTGRFDISQVTDITQDVMISDLSGAGGSITLGEKTLIVISNHQATYAGTIEGRGGFGKYGPGTFTLTGANSYTGGTFIHAGVLALSGGGSLISTGSIDINGRGSFDISAIKALSQTIGDLTGTIGRVLLGKKH